MTREGSMTKAQYAAKLAEKLKVSKAEGGRIVDEVTGLLTSTLKKGDRVRFPGFGTFKVSKRKARIARNPQTGEPVKVPARTVPRFAAQQRRGPVVFGPGRLKEAAFTLENLGHRIC